MNLNNNFDWYFLIKVPFKKAYYDLMLRKNNDLIFYIFMREEALNIAKLNLFIR